VAVFSEKTSGLIITYLNLNGIYFFFLIKIRVVYVWGVEIGEISFFKWILIENPKEILLFFRFSKSGHAFEKRKIKST